MPYLGNTPEIFNFVAGADRFSGNASTTKFLLTRRVGTANDVIAIIENVVQDPFSAYTIAANSTSGLSDITFDSAPPSGTNNIVVNYRATQLVAYNVVDSGQLLANSVTTTKIVDAAVTTAKLSTTGVSATVYGGSDQIPVVTIGVDGRITSAANVSVSIPAGYFTANAIPTMLMLSGM